MSDPPIYLDGFATLPIAPEAKAAIVSALEVVGNAGSPHWAGEKAAAEIEEARSAVADLIGASRSEIIFTSGATEANNLALIGTARRAMSQGALRRQIIVSAIEHKAVLEPAKSLEREGFEILVAPVDRFGRLQLEGLATLIGPQTLLVSVMAANNETGVIQPFAEAAALARAAGALFHCDAAQAAGKLPIQVAEFEPDFLSISSHKLYGPMGVGALYVSAAAPAPQPLFYGGGQQQALRPGTEPVPLIAAFGVAARVAASRLSEDQDRGDDLARRLLDELRVRQTRINQITDGHAVVPGSLAVSFPGIDAEDLCLRLSRDVQISTGSACTSGQLKMSHVLEAMGFSECDARSVLRLFCHRYLSDDDVVRAAELIAVAAQTTVATGGPVQ